MDEYLTRTEAAAHLGISGHTVDHHIKRGQFPEPDLRAGSYSTAPKMWLRSTLDAWQEGRPRRTGPNDGAYGFLDDAA